MAAIVEVSERWQDEALHKDANSLQWTAIRAFDVVGVANTELAGQASGPPYGGVPRIGQPHPRTVSLSARNIDPVRVGLNLFKVTVNYSIGTFSGEEDPLKAPPKIKVTIGSESLPTDHDADGNPIVNSALDAFDPAQPTDNTTIFITITRNEPYWDSQKTLTFSNSINQSPYTLRGVGPLDAGQLLCRTIGPTTEFIEGARFVPIAYEFEARKGNKRDSDNLWDGFKYRLLDQGLRAFYDTNKSARIYDPDQKTASNPSPITTDVRLDGYGGTYSDAYVVTADFKASQSSGKSPIGAIADIASNAVFLKYNKFRRVEFAGLGL